LVAAHQDADLVSVGIRTVEDTYDLAFVHHGDTVAHQEDLV
jgi:hypothetical protein